MRETDITLRSDTPMTDMGHVEHLLKKEMADMMIGIQYDRAINQVPNTWFDRYGEYARMVRSIMKAKGRESYIKVRDYDFYSDDHNKLPEFEGHRNTLEIVESFHRTAAVPTVE